MRDRVKATIGVGMHLISNGQGYRPYFAKAAIQTSF